MTEEQDERRRRRAGLLLGLLALTGIGVTAVLTATLATGASTPPLRLAVTPAGVLVTAGDTATYQISLLRGSERGAVDFTVAELPTGATAAFAPSTTTGDATTLTITTDGDDTDGVVTPAGEYDVVVRATGEDAVAGTTVHLAVQSGTLTGDATPVALSGSLTTALVPGSSERIDVRLRNAGDRAITLTSLGMALDAVTAPRSSAARPCDAGDFAITDYAGPSLTLGAGQAATLSELGVPTAQWPLVRMLNTSANQDGCQNATLNFRYRATGSEA